jgi:hypothetical protein
MKNMSSVLCCTIWATFWDPSITQTLQLRSSAVRVRGQGYYFFHHLGLDKDMRDEHRDSPYFKQPAEFCALYDGAAFDPDLECLPLEAFEPMLRRVFAKPKNSGVYARMQPSGQ